MGGTDLPASLIWESRDLHAMRGTSRTGNSTLVRSESIAIASSTSELNGQTRAHEVPSVKGCVDRLLCIRAEETVVGLTGNDITGIHGILVFDESETIHELDLGDLPGAMGVEMIFNISFGGCRGISKAERSIPSAQNQQQSADTLHTISREITQV